MIHFIALDVHRKTVRACIRNQAGAIVSEHNLEATRESLIEFARKHVRQTDHLALEATFNTWAIARLMEPFVKHLVVSNPMQTKAIAMAKIKTDKVDARVLSDLLRCDYLPKVWMPDEATQRLRRLTCRRSTLVSERTRLKNRIHSVLAALLIPLPVNDLFSVKGSAWLESLELPSPERAQIQSDQRLFDATEAELAILDKELSAAAFQDGRVKLLMTLPGVDYPVAQTLIATLGDIHRFQEAGDTAAYLGLVPSTHQSGPHCYHGPITRHGNGKARWMMVQAAQHVAAHHGPLGVFFRRLLKKKNRNVAVVATARKLVVIAWHMLKNNEPYRYAQPEPTQNKLARLRIKVTGKKRTGGTKKGEARSARYGTGECVRSIPSLPHVYSQEGLPNLTQPKPAESRMLRNFGAQDYVESIKQTSVRRRAENDTRKIEELDTESVPAA
jgi:transposase